MAESSSLDFYIEFYFKIHNLLAIAIAHHMQHSVCCDSLVMCIDRWVVTQNDFVTILLVMKQNRSFKDCFRLQRLFEFLIFNKLNLSIFWHRFLNLKKKRFFNLKKAVEKWSNFSKEKKMVISKKRVDELQHDSWIVQHSHKHTSSNSLKCRLHPFWSHTKNKRQRIVATIYAKGFHFKLPDNQIQLWFQFLWICVD